MKIFVVLAALLGVSFAGLQYPAEYSFGYRARISMGLPGIKPQFSGASLTGDLLVQAIDQGETLIKLSNVRHSEYVEVAACGEQSPINKNLQSRLSESARKIEEPFAVYMNVEQNGVMKVDQSEESWVTDIRKSIALALRINELGRITIDPYHGATSENEHEKTLFGTCEVLYTVLPPDNTTEFTRLERSINFDKCSDRVLLTHAGIGNLTYAGHGQFAAVQSRTSIGNYNLTNVHQDQYVIRNASIEGTVITHPFGIKTDKMVSYANQTIFLLEKRSIGQKLQLPQQIRQIKSWAMEVASPYAAPENPREWMDYQQVRGNQQYLPILAETAVTGMPLDQGLQKQFEEEVKQYIIDAAKLIMQEPNMPNSNTHEPFTYAAGEASYKLESAERMSRGVSLDGLVRIYDSFRQQAQNKDPLSQMNFKLFLDVIAASGSSQAVKLLLEKIENEEIHQARAASLCMTLPNNLNTGAVLDDLMKFIKSKNLQQQPYLTTTCWVNIPLALSRICGNNYSWKYASPYEVYGNSACQPGQYKEELRQFFDEQLQKAGSTWERAVIVHAMSNIEDHSTISSLKQVIYNTTEAARVRVLAVNALTHAKMAGVARDEVFRTLMPIVMNQQQHTQVRQVAFITLLTWKPSPAFYSHVARLSRTENKREMPAFIYFIIEGIAKSDDPSLYKQSAIAEFTLPTVKPFAPSVRYSYQNLWARYLPVDHMKTEFDIQFNIYKEIVPKQLSFFLENSFGGLQTQLLGATVEQRGASQWVFKILDKLRDITPEKSHGVVQDMKARKAHQILENIKTFLNAEKENDEEPLEVDFYVTMLNRIQAHIPINKETITKFFGDQGTRFINRLLKGDMLSFTKYYNPAQMEIFVPTEVGVSLLTRFSTPTLQSAEAYVKMSVPGIPSPTIKNVIHSEYVYLGADSNYRYISKTVSSMRALLPWNQKLIATGVDSLKNVNMPAQFNMTVVNQEGYKNVSMRIIPTVRHEFPAVHMHNIPFNVIKRIWPGGDPNNSSFVFNKIMAQPHNEPIYQFTHPLNMSYTGVVGQATWKSDAAYPYTKGYIMEFLRQPQKFLRLINSPTARYWRQTVTINIDQSQTQEMTKSMSFTTHHQPMKRSSLSSKENIKIGDKQASDMYTIAAELHLNGTKSRTFRTIVNFQNQPQSSSSQKFYFGVQLYRSALPSFDNNPSKYCLSGTSETPVYHTVDEAIKVLQNGEMEMKLDAKINGGHSCDNSQNLANIQGDFTVSQERVQALVNQLEKHCNVDKQNPLLETPAVPVYDQAKINIDYKENAPFVFINATHHLYNTIIGYAFPHSYFNFLYVKNQAQRIDINAQRKMPNNRWSIQTRLPTETIQVEQFYIPPNVESIVPIGGYWETTQQGQKAIIKSRDACVISPSMKQVQSFDGTPVQFKPSPCWTVAVLKKQDQEKFIIRLRKSPAGQVEAQIVSPLSGLIVEMSQSELKVNDKPIEVEQQRQRQIRSSSGRLFAEARKASDFTEVVIPGYMTVRITRDSKIVLLPSLRLQNQVSGICGNYNGEKTDDLVLPSGQKVSQQKHFAALWTQKEGEGCNKSQLQQEKEQAERAQREASGRQQQQEQSRRSQKQESHQRNQESEECEEYVYPVQKVQDPVKGQVICVSRQPVLRCHPTCRATRASTKPSQFNCWSQRQAPSDVKRSESRGYVRHALRVSSQIEKSLETRHDQSCSK